VWPHDTALAALGLSYYGEREGVVKLTAALFEAATQLEMRLPELFCGFHRRTGESPTLYPVSCATQAWAARAMLLLLQACLGLQVSGTTKASLLCDPVLPPFLREVHVRGLRSGGDLVDVSFSRRGDAVDVQVETR
jgi:glycogen debranching enzyme